MSLICRDDSYRRQCDAVVVAADGAGIRLSQSVFYPSGGGQPGDSGWLRWPGGVARIVDATKGEEPDSVVHVPEAGAALPAPGCPVIVELDWERRYAHMRMHTCLHLLCAIIPGQVTGGQVGADKGRLDFNVPAEILDREAIGQRLNALIADAHAVGVRWIDDDQLAAAPELVRTMSVKPPTGTGRVRLLEIEGVDLQPCGGTHVANTREIGPVEVVKIENKGKQNRRIVVAFKS